MKRTALALVLLTLVAGACSREERQLDAARRRWEAAGITTYTYTIVMSCFCPPLDAVVEVVDGRVVSVTPFFIGSITPEARTVEELLADLEQELASADRGDYTIEYDPELGYPVLVVADPIRQAIDDEYSYSIFLEAVTG